MFKKIQVGHSFFVHSFSWVREHKRTAVTVGVALLLLILVSLLVTSYMSKGTSGVPTNRLGFNTVIPTGKSIEQLGGWQRVSPEGSAPVYTYVDSIEGVPINVSQQDIPDSFGTNTNSKVAELAKNFNATNTLNVENLTVYIGTSAKGPQSVIFTKDKTLVLIKSEKEISGTAWTAYINSLQ